MRVAIDSADRLDPTSDSGSFQVRLGTLLKNVRSVTLKDLSIPNTLYNINSSNNQIPFVVDEVTYTATLAPGNYTMNSLAVEVGQAMSLAALAIAATFTCTVSANTFKTTIAINSGEFALLFSSPRTPWKELGFANADTEAAESLTGPFVMQLGLPGYLFVSVREFNAGDNYIGTINGNTASFYVPVTANGGDITFYSQRDFSQTLCFQPEIGALQMLTISLRDRLGNPVSLNGSDWRMLMEIETAK